MLLTVESRDRTLRHRIDTPPTPDDDARVAPLVEEFLAWCETELGMHRETAVGYMVVFLVEHEADEATYRRIAEQRGVLAL